MSTRQILVAIPAPALRNNSRKTDRDDWRFLAGCSSTSARELFPLRHAQRLRSLPLATWVESDVRLLSFLVPFDAPQELARELRFITGCEIVFEHAEGEDIAQAICAAYHASDDHLLPKLARAEQSSGSAQSVPQSLSQSFTQSDTLKSVEAVPLLLEALLERAAALFASDIHLEPTKAGLQLRFRIDGRLQLDTAFSVSSVVGAQLMRRLKLLAGLDVTCDFKPQEGGFTFMLENRELRLRVSFVPQHYGEKAVIRLLENESFKGEPGETSAFRRLGLSEEQERLFLAHLAATSGGILLAGPTGSGKSTLLYAALEHLNAEWRNIISLEDPVERTLLGVNQLEVKREQMAEMLPALLRQDPDVLMVGEIRDRETGETALSAAITGHLVLSTVHAGSALEIFPRLLQLGIKPQLLSCSLRLLVSQRLLPLNCRHCRRRGETPELWRKVLHLGSAPCAESPGCAACRSTGILGRRGVFEFFPVSARAREWIWQCAGENSSLESFAALAREEGHVPLAYAVRDAVLCGDVSPENALKSLGVGPDILANLQEDA